MPAPGAASERLVLISPACAATARLRVPRAAPRCAQSARPRSHEARHVPAWPQRASTSACVTKANRSARQWVRWNMARLNPAGYLQAVELLCNADLGRACRRPCRCEVPAATPTW
jgi:hypothetical protein